MYIYVCTYVYEYTYIYMEDSPLTAILFPRRCSNHAREINCVHYGWCGLLRLLSPFLHPFTLPSPSYLLGFRQPQSISANIATAAAAC